MRFEPATFFVSIKVDEDELGNPIYEDKPIKGYTAKITQWTSEEIALLDRTVTKNERKLLTNAPRSVLVEASRLCSVALSPSEGVQTMRLVWKGVDELASALQKKSETDFKKVEGKNLLEMRNRAVQSRHPSAGGTPVDSSELRLSAGVNLDAGIMGYTKDYAPHVEFGHRQEVGRFVPQIKRRLVRPYVPGQYFLKTNFNIQKPIFRKDLERKIKE